MARSSWTLQTDPQDLIAKADAMSRAQAARFFVSGASYPRFLYRFNPGIRLSALSGFIVSSTVRLASVSEFNDPFDLRANIYLKGNFLEQVEYLARRMRRLEPQFANHPTDARRGALELVKSGQYLKGLQASLESQLTAAGVTCFASTRLEDARQSGPRNILMWSHYASNHAGICLQFHTRRSPSFFASIRRVEYKDELMKINWRDTMGRRDQLFSVLFRKAPVWEYEAEFRVSLPERAGTLESFKPDALTGIVFGCRVDPAVVERVVTLCRERIEKGGSSIRLFRARQSAHSYRLEIQRARDLEPALNTAPAA
jgi:hypothetical protein